MPGTLEIPRDVSILCTVCSDVWVKLKNDYIYKRSPNLSMGTGS